MKNCVLVLLSLLLINVDGKTVRRRQSDFASLVLKSFLGGPQELLTTTPQPESFLYPFLPSGVIVRPDPIEFVEKQKTYDYYRKIGLLPETFDAVSKTTKTPESSFKIAKFETTTTPIANETTTHSTHLEMTTVTTTTTNPAASLAPVQSTTKAKSKYLETLREFSAINKPSWLQLFNDHSCDSCFLVDIGKFRGGWTQVRS